MATFLAAHSMSASKPTQGAYNYNSPSIQGGSFPFCVDELGVQLAAPAIDKITLSGVVPWDGKPDDLVVQITALVESLKKTKAFTIIGLKYRAYKPIRKLGWCLLVAGPRERPVRVELRIDHKPGCPKSLRLRLEFNPRKLKKHGVATLKKFLAALDVLGLDHRAWLQAAFVSRIDIAVDILGASPGDIRVYEPEVAFRRVYVGEMDLETEYLSKRTKCKGRRSVRDLVRIYDRNAVLKLQGKQPPFGDTPLTRVELMPNMMGYKMTLTKLRQAKCLIEATRISHINASPAANSPLWLLWVDIARARGPEHASRRLALPPSLAWQFEKEWRSPSTMLVPVQALWEHWGAAFEIAGLGLLVGE